MGWGLLIPLKIKMPVLEIDRHVLASLPCLLSKHAEVKAFSLSPTTRTGLVESPLTRFGNMVVELSPVRPHYSEKKTYSILKDRLRDQSQD